MYTGISVFDLDHTLITANSSFRFGAYLYRRGFFPFSVLMRCLSYYMSHKWLGLSIFDLHHKIFLVLFQGRQSSEIENYVEEFLDQELHTLLYDPVVKRLQDAKEKGHYTLILSASPHFIVRSIASRLNVHSYQSSFYVTDSQGCYKGIDSIVEGEKKVECVKHVIKQMGITASIYAYSDSCLDLPVLKMAEHAIAVKPDRRLRQISLKNGWEIMS